VIEDSVPGKLLVTVTVNSMIPGNFSDQRASFFKQAGATRGLLNVIRNIRKMDGFDKLMPS
jgi:hypothetical protein